MDNYNPGAPEPDSGPKPCINCQVEQALDGYPTPLCITCRDKFVRYPIPKWIYAFGAGTLIVMIFSLINLPGNFSTALAFGKAEKAIEHRNYITAQNNLKMVLARFPDFNDANAYMFIASCYTLNLQEARDIYIRNENKQFEKDLMDQMNVATTFISPMVTDDTTFHDLLDAAVRDSITGLQKLFDELDTAGRKDKLIMEYLVADRVYEAKDYTTCKKMLSKILGLNNDMYLAWQLMAATDRELKNYNDAIADCDKMLSFNNEDVGAIAQKAKIELKRRNDKIASDFADKALSINDKDIYAMEAKALVAHFAGRKKESEQMLALLYTTESDSGKFIYNRVLRVMNGTAPFR